MSRGRAAAVLVTMAVVLGVTGASAVSPVVSTIAGNGSARLGANGVAAVRGGLDQPAGISLDGRGDVFIADSGHCEIREVPTTPTQSAAGAMRAGHSYVAAGDGCHLRGGFHSGALATHSAIGFADDVAVAPDGDLFVAATSLDRILEVPASSGEQFGIDMEVGHIYAIVGDGHPGFNGDGMAGTASEVDGPAALAVDGAGDVFISDTLNCRVRELSGRDQDEFGVSMTAGHLYTVAGSGSCGGTAIGDGGPALGADVWDPMGLVVDAFGDLIVADRGNDAIREIVARSGTYYGVPIGADDIATIAGDGYGYGPYLVDGLSATGETAELNFPFGVALDRFENLYITDTESRAIRVVPASNTTVLGRSMDKDDMYTLAGAIPTGSDRNGTGWVLTHLTYPYGIAVDAGGDVVFSDQGTDLVREIHAH